MERGIILLPARNSVLRRQFRIAAARRGGIMILPSHDFVYLRLPQNKRGHRRNGKKEDNGPAWLRKCPPPASRNCPE